MPKLYYAKNITSIKGNRLGLSVLSSGETGTSKKLEFLIGPETFRHGVTTSETTGTNIGPTGFSHVRGTSADSSSVFTIDPPIPGVEKSLYFNSTGNTACYVKTANSEVFHSTLGSSFTVLKSTIGGLVKLLGVTTGIWGLLGVTSGTSSNAGGFSLTTTT